MDGPRRLTAIAGSALDQLDQLREVLGRLHERLCGLPPLPHEGPPVCPVDLESLLCEVETNVADLLDKARTVEARV